MQSSNFMTHIRSYIRPIFDTWYSFSSTKNITLRAVFMQPFVEISLTRRKVRVSNSKTPSLAKSATAMSDYYFTVSFIG